MDADSPSSFTKMPYVPTFYAVASNWWFSIAVALFGACTILMCLKFVRKQDPYSDLQAMKYIPWAELDDFTARDLAQTVVVDCTHPSVSISLTHHRQVKALPPSLRGDASTDVVLNALEQKHPLLYRDKQYVSCNHFDVDGYLSVLATLKPQLALQYNNLFRCAARIGDFRELVVDEQGTLGGKEEEAHALEVCCWLNALEMQRFWRPFDKNEEDPSESLHDVDKWAYFLSPAVLEAFEAVIRGDVNAMPSDDASTNQAHSRSWQAERDIVHRDSMLVANSSITKVPEVGLVVIGPLPQPVHYYALFSATIGVDVLLTLVITPNGGLVAEVEQKYTTFVDLAFRPTLPRVDLLPLASLLNALEAKHGGLTTKPGVWGQEAHSETVWVGERFVDSGPLLRLERRGQPLTKASRYGHPSERYAALFHAGESATAPVGNNGAAAAKVDADHVPTTCIPREVLVAAVEGYLRAAYGKLDGGSTTNATRSGSERALEPPTKPHFGWTWKGIREFNAKIAAPRVRAWLWSEHQLQPQEDKHEGDCEAEKFRVIDSTTSS